MDKVCITKIRRYLYLWIKITWRRTIAPITDPAAILNLLAFPFFLFLVFLAQGLKVASEEFFISLAAGKALLWAVPFFILWNAVSAAFSVKKEEERIGQWFDGWFVYRAPVLVARFRVSDKDNNILKAFKISQAEVGGYAELEIHFGGFERTRIQAQIVTEIEGKKILIPWDKIQNSSNYSTVYVDGKKQLYLATKAETQNSTIISIYLTQWSVY